MKKIFVMVLAMVVAVGTLTGCEKASTSSDVIVIDNTKTEEVVEETEETSEKEAQTVIIKQKCGGNAFWANEEHTQHYNISDEDVNTYFGQTITVTFTVYDWNDYTYEITSVEE